MLRERQGAQGTEVAVQGKAQRPRGQEWKTPVLNPPSWRSSITFAFYWLFNKGVGVRKFCVPFQPWPLVVLRFSLVSAQPSLLPGSRQNTFPLNISLFLYGSSSLSLTQTAPAADVILCPSEMTTAPITC